MVQVHPPAPDPLTPTAADPLDRALAGCLETEAPQAGERWLVAFSGGPDSLALAAALAPPAAECGLVVELAHVDHGLDADSPRRAERARELAARLGLPFHLRRLDLADARRRNESPEAAARRRRYAALKALRAERDATLLLTAHHRDDQVETLLLQLARGVAVERLVGIAAARGPLRRPLLTVRRREITARLAREGLEPVRDPTNDDLALPRNRLRHRTLPALRAVEPGLDAALLKLGARAAALRTALGHRFAQRFDAATTERAAPELPLELLLGLPAGLRPAALRWILTERLGVGQLPSFPSMKAFLSVLEAGKNARLALPPRDARSLLARRGRLSVETTESRTSPFSYTFSMPGEVELPELGLRLRIRRSPVEPWMFRGEPQRAGFSADAAQATVRNRRAGDRLTPLGAAGRRKLKAVLIDRGVPAEVRDRLPLLEIAGEMAWIPGITIGAGFALAGDGECWLAELEPLAATSAVGARGSERKTTT